MAVLVGKSAPDFAAQAVLPDGSFKELKLSDHQGKYVVLYFYPRDDTRGCTIEAKGFRDSWADLQKAGIEVFGIVGQEDSNRRRHQGRLPNSGRSVRVRLSSQKPSTFIIVTSASHMASESSVGGTRVMMGPK